VSPPPRASAAGIGATRPDARTSPSPAATTTRRRVVAIDVVRGFSVVILLLAVHPGPRDGLPLHLGHHEWAGLTFADTIFPLFLFAVGASMPFSERASTPGRVLRRVAVLTLIGIVLVTLKNRELTLPGVLQHIAVAYLLAWLVLRLPRRAQLAVWAALVLGTWLAYELLHDPGVDPWGRRGTFAHLANEPFFGRFATEGVPQTLISTINVLAGAVAGRVVAGGADGRAALRRVAPWAVAYIGLGVAMAAFVPLNKHIWTPSFAVLTVGTSFAYFALALWLVDVRGGGRWVRPLIVLGSNAIAVYVLTLAAGAVLGPAFRELSAPLEPMGDTALALSWSVAWLLAGLALCEVLYRRRIFVKV
jgi:predicted acyltransferase